MEQGSQPCPPHMERMGYGFEPEAKRFVHARAGDLCEFPAEPCPRPNNGIVHHLTGVYEARLSGMPREVVHDPDLNALMLCDPHAEQHDIQERYQVENLELSRGRIIYDSSRPKRHKRRRR